MSVFLNYINCIFSNIKDGIRVLARGEIKNKVNIIVNGASKTAIEKVKKAPKMDFKNFEDTPFFEGCMPIEEIIRRGDETLRYGPMKPVGLTNPHKKEEPYAVVQLRQDNKSGTLYNIVGFQMRGLLLLIEVINKVEKEI